MVSQEHLAFRISGKVSFLSPPSLPVNAFDKEDKGLSFFTKVSPSRNLMKSKNLYIVCDMMAIKTKMMESMPTALEIEVK